MKALKVFIAIGAFVGLAVVAVSFASHSTVTTAIASGVASLFRNKEPITLTFAGDIMLDRYIREMNADSGYQNILKNISPLLDQSDFVVANLEGPVTAYPSYSSGTLPAEPNNFVFTFSPSAVQTLSNAGVDAVSLGNNHILNFGTDGLEQTKKYLQEADLKYFGEPYTNSILTQDINGISVGFVAFNEFFPFNEEELVQSIENLSRTVDFVVVYTHWGSEYETTANAFQQQLAHRFIDAGADTVIGSHPHVIQNKELYKGKTIYYSLGNFIFDQYWKSTVRCGALVTLTITPPNMSYTTDESFTWLEKDGSTATSTCGAF
ncbi:CapA family protein [Candidatus Campbellbacteria bacterium]|nr:MAG: CapA family protein [Candidatus Campbellbacteria bacterium]